MKAVFSPNENYHKSAYMNWRMEPDDGVASMFAMAKGFLSSSIDLCDVCLKNNRDKKADMLIFPIFSNANHGIELYLKTLIWILNKLLNTKLSIEGNHNILQMLTTAQSKIKAFKGKALMDKFNSENTSLINYINELYAITGGNQTKDFMDFSRYPFTKKQEDHFYVVVKGNVTVDLENFRLRLTEILHSLYETVSYYYYDELHGEPKI